MGGMGECVFLEPLVNVREKENAVTVIMKNVNFWLGLDNNIVGAIAVHWWSTHIFSVDVGNGDGGRWVIE